MRNIDGISTNRRYFAAANGYSGFRSYFPRIFDSAAYRRIFVLKGGPGTGKSSLMKKITREFPDGVYRTEAIFCSSDPASLDGVIVESKKGRVAVLDGTAPHERDAVIPGAIDEIVNLGAAWDAEALEKERERILTLGKEKSFHYGKAYDYLSAFGKTAENSEAESNPADISNLRDEIGARLFQKEGDGFREECRLIRAFGCRGEVLLPTFGTLADTSYLLSGSTAHKERVLREVRRVLEEKKLPVVVAPSPFDPDRTDGILCEGAGVSFLAVGETGTPWEIDAFFPTCRREQRGESSLLSLAEASFAKASECHFALEKMYTAAMDFSVIDGITQNIISRMSEILR